MTKTRYPDIIKDMIRNNVTIDITATEQGIAFTAKNFVRNVKYSSYSFFLNEKDISCENQDLQLNALIKECVRKCLYVPADTEVTI